jgi:hypothetical protein
MQRPMANPREQLVEVGRAQHRLERVALARLLRASRDADEVQVVVAEDGDRAIAERPHEAQAFAATRDRG